MRARMCVCVIREQRESRRSVQNSTIEGQTAEYPSRVRDSLSSPSVNIILSSYNANARSVAQRPLDRRNYELSASR